MLKEQVRWNGNKDECGAKPSACDGKQRPSLDGAAGQERKDRLLKRLVKFAKGEDGEEHELSSYASYEKVAKGARRMASAPEGHETRQRTSTAADRGAAGDASMLSRGGLGSQSVLSGGNSMQIAAVNNLQAFLKETSHDASKIDPDFDLAGVSYVFRLLFMGTMPWANRVSVCV